MNTSNSLSLKSIFKITHLWWFNSITFVIHSMICKVEWWDWWLTLALTTRTVYFLVKIYFSILHLAPSSLYIIDHPPGLGGTKSSITPLSGFLLQLLLVLFRALFPSCEFKVAWMTLLTKPWSRGRQPKLMLETLDPGLGTRVSRVRPWGHRFQGVLTGDSSP